MSTHIHKCSPTFISFICNPGRFIILQNHIAVVMHTSVVQKKKKKKQLKKPPKFGSLVRSNMLTQTSLSEFGYEFRSLLLFGFSVG